jgi:precorrin-6Y C5,15-methyltransferase (decarboxylating)
MGMSPNDLTARHLEMIHTAHVLVGGKRLLDYFKDTSAEKKIIGGNLKQVVAFIEERLKAHDRIVVLCSGDPLFFGMGSLLATSLGRQNIRVHPNITAVAAAFARIGEPWQDACVLSFHGRNPEKKLLAAASDADKIALLTDPVHTPGQIAGLLVGHNKIDFDICVFEKMGTLNETIGWYTLEQAAQMDFDEPNVVLLKRTRDRGRTPSPPKLHLGMPEECYDHQRGLITKAEVRAVTIAKLSLCDHHVLWDLGAGSGSISIEAGVLIKTGKIFAVEKDPARVEQIRANAQKFGVFNLQVVPARLPCGLDGLETPDRIFIGGGGKDLPDIIRGAAGHLAKDGVMVVNTVLTGNLTAALEVMHRLGFTTDAVQVQVSRSQAMPYDQRFAAGNPVWIIRGRAVN